MDRQVKDNIFNGLFLCATLTSRRTDHTSFVQARAETSDTGAEAVKSDPNCSWQGHSSRLVADIGDESTESRSVLQSLRVPLVTRPERRTFVVVVR